MGERTTAARSDSYVGNGFPSGCPWNQEEYDEPA